MKNSIFIIFLIFLGCNASNKTERLTINSTFLIKEFVLKQTSIDEFREVMKQQNISFQEENIEGYENIQTDEPLSICGNDERAAGTRKIFKNEKHNLEFVFKLQDKKWVLTEYFIGDFSLFNFKEINPKKLLKKEYETQAPYFFDHYFQLVTHTSYQMINYQKVDDTYLEMISLHVMISDL